MTTTTQIKTPHDRYFRAVMSDLRIARQFFHEYLPENIRKLVDLNTLQLRKDTFVDKTLRYHLTDMLFSAEFAGQPGYLYFLQEHKSKPEKFVTLDLWRYILAILTQDIKENKRKILPVVYPIIYYNGRVSYPYSTNFFDLFGKNAVLAREILLNPFQLIDLTRIPDEQLRTQPWIGLMGFMMKHCRSRDILDRFKEAIPLLRRIEKSGGGHYIETTLYYLMETTKIPDENALIDIIKQDLSYELGEKTMTLAQRLIMKGRKEGKTEGKAEGKAEGKIEEKLAMTLNLLQIKMPIDTIKVITGLSIEEIKKIQEKRKV